MTGIVVVMIGWLVLSVPLGLVAAAVLGHGHRVRLLPYDRHLTRPPTPVG